MGRAGRVLVAVAMLGGVASGQPTPPVEPANASEPIVVTGRVIDQFGKPIRGVAVTIEGVEGPVPAVTDNQGRYKLRAPIGATLVLSSDKYGASLATVTGPLVVEVVMLRDVQGEEIEISSEAPTVAAGAATLDREEINRIPGTGGDVVRTLTALPGVVNTQLPVGYAGVVIRGASPQDSKTLVDDFEIPILFHPFGFRAVVPTEAIQTLSFIPGGFDVAYGRSSSGIVQLTTRAGGDDRTEQVEASLVDGSLIAQGMLSPKTRYMFALRRSLIDFFLPLFIPDSVDLSLTTVPSYWDEQFRLDHQLSTTWDLTLSSLGTTDTFELYTTKDEDAKAKRFYARTRFVRLTAAARYHEGPWSASLALSGMLQDVKTEIGLYQHLDTQTPTLTPRASVTRTKDKSLGLADVVWTAGVEAQLGHSTTDIAIPTERREGEPFEPYDPNDTATSFKGAVWFPDYAAWTSLAATFHPRVRITAGVRADYFGRPQEIAVQPRTEIQLKLRANLTARLGAGAYRRPPEFQSEFLEKSLKSERSEQNTMGLEWFPIPGVRVQGTLYYTLRSALITRDDDGSLGNTGRGSSKGAEILAMLSNGKTWFGWFGYAYSHSERVDDPGGEARLFDYDQPHSLNAAASWRHGRWTLGGRFSLYSGLPLTPVLGAEFDSDRNLHIPTNGPVNSDRAPLHHQLDVRIDYAWTWGPAKMLAFLDVQNTYLQRSVVTYFYSYDYTQKSAFESLPLVPSIGLRGVL